MTLDQRILLAADDGTAGPLLRIAEDRLEPGSGYGRHAHQEVDVVAVVLAGALTHRWGDGAAMTAGDVGVLRAGTGLDHDEVAGPDGARTLQCYLRSAAPGAAPAHEVHRAADGWVDLRRPDARLWVGRTPGAVPAGLLVLRTADGALVEHQRGRPVDEAGVALVWALDRRRPAWAVD
jgi:quercetin 2,3-dioxygenase